MSWYIFFQFRWLKWCRCLIRTLILDVIRLKQKSKRIWIDKTFSSHKKNAVKQRTNAVFETQSYFFYKRHERHPTRVSNTSAALAFDGFILKSNTRNSCATVEIRTTIRAHNNTGGRADNRESVAVFFQVDIYQF